MVTMNPRPMVLSPRKLAFFDSGLGGLTVLNPFLTAFPQSEFIYFGDLARLPYGNKTPEMIRRYLEEGLNLLAEERPEAIVVACHSASTQVRESHWLDIPLFDVLRPIAEEAAQISTHGRIGVIATRATISQGVFSRWIHQVLPEAQVTEQACPLFVPLIEEGWIDDPITNLVAYRYLTPLREKACDTLVLGCTHYPIISHTILKAMSPLHPELVHAGPVLVERLTSFFMAQSRDSTPGEAQRQGGDFAQSSESIGLSPLEVNTSSDSPSLDQRLKILVSEKPSTTWRGLVQTILEIPDIPDIEWMKPPRGH